VIGEAMMKLARIFEDRIFIADGLKESGAREDWFLLKKLVYYDPEPAEVTPREFWYSRNKLHDREDHLREKILDLARKDIVKFKFFGMIPVDSHSSLKVRVRFGSPP
jgi:hypothetical protein